MWLADVSSASFFIGERGRTPITNHPIKFRMAEPSLSCLIARHLKYREYLVFALTWYLYYRILFILLAQASDLLLCVNLRTNLIWQNYRGNLLGINAISGILCLLSSWQT